MTETLGSAPGSPGDGDTTERLSYTIGDKVRVYADRPEGRVPEDDWEYRGYEEASDLEQAARMAPEGTHTETRATPKPEFDTWQRQKLAEEAGRLATSSTIEASSVVTDEAMDFIRIAERYHLRPETVEKALSLGVEDPIRYLLQARRHEPLRKRLEHHGFDMSPPASIRDPEFDDPVSELNAEGNSRRDEIKSIQDALQTDKGVREIRKTLKNPAPLPLGLHKIPVIGKRAGKAVKAWQILQKEKEHRRKTQTEEMPDGTKVERPVTYNDGRFGIGFKEWKEYYIYLTRLSAAIAADRTKLSPANVHEIRGPLDEVRRNLAELILKDRYALRSALENNEIVPVEIYRHKPISDRWKDYRSSLNPEALNIDREMYVDLVNKPDKAAADVEKIKELEKKYPGWIVR